VHVCDNFNTPAEKAALKHTGKYVRHPSITCEDIFYKTIILARRRQYIRSIFAAGSILQMQPGR
jgi:hypothetical protein